MNALMEFILYCTRVYNIIINILSMPTYLMFALLRQYDANVCDIITLCMVNSLETTDCREITRHNYNNIHNVPISLLST